MKTLAYPIVHAMLALLVMLAATTARAEEPSAREILDRVERLLWGTTVQGEYEMTITTPRWQRSLGLRMWMERPKRSFVRIMSPARRPVSARYALAARCGTTCPTWNASSRSRRR